MSRKLLLGVGVLLLGFAVIQGRAAPVDLPAARAAADRWLAINPTPTVSTPQRGQLWTTSDLVSVLAEGAGNPLAYAIALDPSGFVVVSADDRIDPILFFSIAGGVPDLSDPQGPLRAMLLADLPARQAAAAESGEDARAAIAAQWQPATRAPGAFASVSVSVQPLLTTEWTQSGGPYGGYNKYAPDGMPAGCGPLAGAQVMRYYNWPRRVDAVGAFTQNILWSASNVRITGDLDFQGMPVRLDGVTTPYQTEQIAQLLRFAGAAFHANYMHAGTGGLPGDIANGMRRVFGYNCRSQSVGWFGDLSNSSARVLVQNEVSGRHPVILMIWPGAVVPEPWNGHYVVADGLGSSGGTSPIFHLNFGWATQHDGWYVFPAFDARGRTWDTYAVVNSFRCIDIRRADVSALAAEHETSLRGWANPWGDFPPFVTGAKYRGDRDLYVGNDQYGPGSSVTKRVRAGQPVRFQLCVQNDGTRIERFRVRAPATVADCAVSYEYFNALPNAFTWESATNPITSDVGFVTGDIRPCQAAYFAVQMTPTEAVAVNGIRSLVFRAEPVSLISAADEITLNVQRITGRPELWVRGNPANAFTRGLAPQLTSSLAPAELDVQVINTYDTPANFLIETSLQPIGALASYLGNRPDLSGWRMTVTDGAGREVTAQAQAGRLAVNSLAVDGIYGIHVRVSPDKTVPGGSGVTLAVRARPATPTIGLTEYLNLDLLKALSDPKLQFQVGTRSFTEQEEVTQPMVAGRVRYQVRIRNAGEVADVFDIRVSADTAGWATALGSPAAVSLAVGAETMVNVDVRSPATLTGVARILVEAVARNDSNAGVRQRIRLVRPGPAVQVKVQGEETYAGDRVVSAATPVDNQVYVFRVRNDGPLADTFTLRTTEEGTGGWQYRYFDAPTGGNEITDALRNGTWQTGALPPAGAGFQELRVELVPGAGTTAWSTSSVNIRATSGLHNVVFAEAVATTYRVRYEPKLFGVINGQDEPHSDLLPGVLVQPGTPAVLDLLVVNGSDVTDTCSLQATLTTSSAGWTVTVETLDRDPNTVITGEITGGGWQTGALTSHAQRRLRARITPGPGVPGNGWAYLAIRATSLADAQATATLGLRVTRGDYRPDLQVHPEGDPVFGDGYFTLTTDAAGRSRYALRILNAGPLADSYTLRAEVLPGGAGTWTAQFTDADTGLDVLAPQAGSRNPWTVGPLAPGAGHEFNLTLLAGQDVTAPGTCTVRVRAVSHGDPERSDVLNCQAIKTLAHLDLRVLQGDDYREAADLVFVTGGGDVVREFCVVNRGTVSDAFRLSAALEGDHAAEWTARWNYAPPQGPGDDVTNLISVPGGWVPGTLDPGQTAYFWVTLSPGATVPANDTVGVRVRAQSGVTPAVGDELVVQVRKGGPSQPNAFVRIASDSAWVDSRAYGGAITGSVAAYHVRVVNAGLLPDRFVTRMARSTETRGVGDWTVQVYDAAQGGGLITDWISGGSGWGTPILLPGQEVVYRAEVTPGDTVPAGERLTLDFTVCSQSDAALADAVQAETGRTTFATVMVQAVPAAPQPAATTVTLTATPDPVPAGRTLEYRFVVDNVVRREWNTVPTFDWRPADYPQPEDESLPPVEGPHALKVFARDAEYPLAMVASPVLSYLVRSPASRDLPRRCVPDGFVDVFVLVDPPAAHVPTITSFSVVENLPPNWVYDRSFIQPLPDVLPEQGAGGEITFTWNTLPLPALPLRFGYRVRVPASHRGLATFGAGFVRYTTSETRAEYELAIAGTDTTRGPAFFVAEATPGEATGLGSTAATVGTTIEIPEGSNRTFSVTIDGGTGPFTYAWSQRGQLVVGATTSQYTYSPGFNTVVHPDRSDGEWPMVCTVTDSSPTPQQVTVTWSTATVTDSDRPAPAPATVIISPAAPRTDHDLQAFATDPGADPDGDTVVGYEYRWTCPDHPGTVVGEWLAHAFTRKGQVWTLQARPRTLPYGDGEVVSSLFGEAQVTIGDTAPVALPPAGLATPVNTSLPVTLAAFDPDVDDGVDTFTFAVLDNPVPAGSVSSFDPAAGTLNYGAPTVPGQDRFDYTVSDGTSTTAAAQVKVLAFQGWLFPLQVAQADTSTLRLGVATDATAGVDNGVDQPADPPGEIVAGRVGFVSGVADPELLWRDVRGALAGSVWKVRVVAGTQDVVLSWNPADLPAGGLTLWRMDNADNPIPNSDRGMATTTTVTVLAGETVRFGIATTAPGASGTIQVETSQPNATFNLFGPQNYADTTGAGSAWAQTGAPGGDYLIVFQALPGYRPPPPERRFLAAGATLTFTGTYVDERIWDCTIALTQADKAQVVFGTAAGATNGFDAGLDLETSPTPPADVGGAFFYTAPDGTPMSRDYRDYLAESAEWVLFITPGATPVDLSWAQPPVPATRTLLLVEVNPEGQPIGSMVNMTVTTNLTVSGTTQRIFRIRYAPPAPLVLAAVSPGPGSGATVTVTTPVNVPEAQTQTFAVAAAEGRPPYTFVWRLGGEIVGGAADTFVLAPGYGTVQHPATTLNRTLVCDVTDSASRAVASATWETVAVIDQNRVPLLGTAVVELAGITKTGVDGGVGRGDDLRAMVTGTASDSDPEDAVRYRFLWTDPASRALLRDTVAPVNTMVDILPAGTASRGQPVTVTVTAVDYVGNTAIGGASSATQASLPIVNTVPTITGASIDHDANWQTLTAVPAGWSDPDGDTPAYRYVWSRNGTVISDATGATLARPAFARTDSIRCTVAPWDGMHEGAARQSDAVVIPDAPWLWQVEFTITGAADSKVSFGMQPESSDGLDNGLDINAGAAPPHQAGHVFFVGPGGVPLTRDARGVTAAAEYMLVVDAGDAPIRLQWTVPLSLPAGRYLSLYTVIDPQGTGTLEPVGGSALNLNATAELNVPANVTRLFVIRYAADLTIVLGLEAGWNLISLPIVPNDPAVGAVFNVTASREAGYVLRDSGRGVIYSGSVWAWDAAYAPAGALLAPGRYVAAEQVQALVGYWVCATMKASLLVRGVPPATADFDLKRGWNLVGVPGAVAVPTHANLRGRWWAWLAQDRTYDEVAATLYPEVGYWIYSTAAFQLPFSR